MIKIKPAQSILEYAILIAIVIAAIVVMQVYMKRGISGRLKESSDKISGGEAFSASNTTTFSNSNTAGREIIEMTATDSNAADLAGTIAPNVVVSDISSQGTYSAGSSKSGKSTSYSASATSSAANEAFKAKDLKSDGTTDNF